MKLNQIEGQGAVEFRKNVLAGIAVLGKECDRAKKIAENLDAPGELALLRGSRYDVFGAVTDEGLDALSALQVALANAKVGLCLCTAVPTAALQTEPEKGADGVSRQFCSMNGLPIRVINPRDGKTSFTRPSFWLIDAKVDASGNETYLATMFGQYRNEDQVLEYKPVPRKNAENGEVVTKAIDNVEDLVAETGIADGFLHYMMRPVRDLARTASGAQSLRRAVNSPLRVSLREMGDHRR